MNETLRIHSAELWRNWLMNFAAKMLLQNNLGRASWAIGLADGIQEYLDGDRQIVGWYLNQAAELKEEYK